MSTRIVPVLLCGLSIFASGIAMAGPRLTAVDGWIREAPPSAPVRAGYVELRNDGAEAIRVTGARSEAFGAVEIHEMAGEDGMMRMRRLPELVIPAGEGVSLEPGGKHFMLFRPQQPLAAGESVRLLLDVAEGEPVEIELIQR